MSMLCNLYALTPAQIETIESRPEAVGELLGCEPPAKKVGIIAKLFGKAPVSPGRAGHRLEPIPESETFELDKAWHILHFLFSGSAEEGPWPASFILSGGQEVGPDLGYGSPRLLTPKDLSEIASFLQTLSLQGMAATYKADAIRAAKVYWKPSESDDECQRQVEDIWSIMQSLRDFVIHLAQSGRSALIHIY